MSDFKAIIFTFGSFFFALLICLDTIKSAFDGQCWIVFDTMFWTDKFYQHCLGHVRYIHKRYHTFIFTRSLAETAETAAL
jgi:hypothetical protein